MKKYIYILLFIIFAFKAHSHTSHYQGLIKIEMDVIRNGEIIGYSNYFFEHEDEKMTVKNYTNFKVDLFGVRIMEIFSALPFLFIVMILSGFMQPNLFVLAAILSVLCRNKGRIL